MSDTFYNSATATDWGSSYTPTVTLNGTGTIPTYSTVEGEFTRLGNLVLCSFLLTNTSGGTAGAGTGIINISIPLPVASTYVSSNASYAIGRYLNNTSSRVLNSRFVAGANTVELTMADTATTAVTDVTAVTQNNAARTLRGEFWYLTD